MKYECDIIKRLSSEKVDLDKSHVVYECVGDYTRGWVAALEWVLKDAVLTPVEADAQKPCRCYKFYKQQNSYSFCPGCGRALRTA